MASLPKFVLALTFAAAAVAGEQMIVRSIVQDLPKRPEVAEAVRGSLRAELAGAAHPLAPGKTLAWSAIRGDALGASTPLQGTATVVGRDAKGCYDMNVVPNMNSLWTKGVTLNVCP